MKFTITKLLMVIRPIQTKESSQIHLKFTARNSPQHETFTKNSPQNSPTIHLKFTWEFTRNSPKIHLKFTSKFIDQFSTVIESARRLAGQLACRPAGQLGGQPGHPAGRPVGQLAGYQPAGWLASQPAGHECGGQGRWGRWMVGR